MNDNAEPTPEIPERGPLPTDRRPALRRRKVRSARTAAILATTLAAAFATTAAARAGGGHSDLAKVRRATAAFRDVKVAENPGGYQRFVDVNGVACIDMPGLGAMGVHYVNGDLVGDGEIDPLRPEAMVYEPDADGELTLVAVEYVVPKAAWDAHHSAPPVLFDTTFDFTPSPNRFGLPDFYSLHAWTQKHNPAGTFAMWNPRVNCAATGDHEGHHTDEHGDDTSGHDMPSYSN